MIKAFATADPLALLGRGSTQAKEIQMLRFLKIQTLVCVGCDARTLLPNQTPQGMPFVPTDLPTDVERLVFVCHSCGRLFGYSSEQSRLEEIPEDDPRLQTRTFRKVAFACDQENCDRQIVVHLETEKEATADAITIRVLTASPNVSHAEGHILPQNHILTANCELVCNEIYPYF